VVRLTSEGYRHRRKRLSVWLKSGPSILLPVLRAIDLATGRKVWDYLMGSGRSRAVLATAVTSCYRRPGSIVGVGCETEGISARRCGAD